MSTHTMRHIRTLDAEKDRGLLITLPNGTVVRLAGVEDVPGGASRVLIVIGRDSETRYVRMSAHTVLEVENPYDDLI